jgi:hypothetical protein
LKLDKLKKIILKMENKKAEIFGMSFGMIFSIILIIFFIAGAFIAIKAFIGWQKTAQMGLFARDFQAEIDDAWNSEKTSFVFNYSLPSYVNYVCLADFSSNPKNANNVETGIYQNIKEEGYSVEKNLYFYKNERPRVIQKAVIKHIDLSKKNPICFKVSKGKISVKIEKKSGNPLVEISY